MKLSTSNRIKMPNVTDSMTIPTVPTALAEGLSSAALILLFFAENEIKIYDISKTSSY